MFIFVKNKIMGKILLSAFLLSIGFAAGAQSIVIRDTSGTIVNGDTVTFVEYYRSGGQTTFDHKAFVTITNNTTDTMVLTLSRTEEQIIAGSYDFYCYGQTCLAPVKAGVSPFLTSQTDTVRVDPAGLVVGDSPFTVYIDSAFNGIAIYRYELSDKRNRTNNAAFFIRWDIRNVTSLEERKTNSDFSIYPNPATTAAIINFETPLNFNRQEVQVFNILGEQVFTSSMNKGTSTYELNVDGFPKGIYFVNVIADGARVSSKKMIVK